MNGGTSSENQTQDGDLQADRDMDETVVLTEEPVADIGDTAEIAVDELVAKIESGDEAEAEKKRQVKRRLDKMQEEIGDNLDSTYNISLDDDD